MVDMVHFWDNHGKVGGATRKEQHCVLEYLTEGHLVVKNER